MIRFKWVVRDASFGEVIKGFPLYDAMGRIIGQVQAVMVAKDGVLTSSDELAEDTRRYKCEEQT